VAKTWSKGEAKYTAVCAACHGADGNSAIPANPKLAQQHPEYLVKQLQEFKSGKRANAIMQGFAATLSDDDMKNIAYWVAAKKAKPGFAKDKELVPWASASTAAALQDRQIAACAGCHSPNGAGIPAQYPRLSGQHADYTDGPAEGLPRRLAQEQPADDPGGRQAERPRNQGRVRLHRRPALSAHWVALN
jgi:cytochrome c553